MSIRTIGYRKPGALAELDRLLADPKTVVVDIRYRATSRWLPEWRKSSLSSRYGCRYLHMRGLGNINYKHPELGIELFAPDGCLYELGYLLRSGWSLVLLCGCPDYDRCHRKVVFERLKELEVQA